MYTAASSSKQQIDYLHLNMMYISVKTSEKINRNKNNTTRPLLWALFGWMLTLSSSVRCRGRWTLNIGMPIFDIIYHFIWAIVVLSAHSDEYFCSLPICIVFFSEFFSFRCRFGLLHTLLSIGCCCFFVFFFVFFSLSIRFHSTTKRTKDMLCICNVLYNVMLFRSKEMEIDD